MSNIGSYDERIKDFSWAISEKELDYKDGDVLNIFALKDVSITLSENSVSNVMPESGKEPHRSSISLSGWLSRIFFKKVVI